MKIYRYFPTILVSFSLLELSDGYLSSYTKVDLFYDEDDIIDADMEKKQSTADFVSVEDENTILQIHKTSRSQVQASNMMTIRYNADIAVKAQYHADSCTFQHDLSSDRMVTGLGGVQIGQNLCKGFTSWPDCISAWINEKNNFVYGIGSANGGEVRHYTQMVLWKTIAIGCGYNPCNGTAFHVCNYAYVQYKSDVIAPWKIGEKCSSCPNNCDGEGFCDCGGQVCSSTYMIPSPKCQCTNWWLL